MPPSRDAQLRQRSGSATAAGDPPGAAADPEPGERPGSRGGSAPNSAKAPGRQPYLPFAVEAPELGPSGSGLQQGLRRLAAGLIPRGSSAAKRDEDAYQRRQAAKKHTASEEAEALPLVPGRASASNGSSGTSAPRLVPVVVELEGGGYGGAPPGLQQAQHPAQSQRRVAFETTVELDTGGTAPLRSGVDGVPVSRVVTLPGCLPGCWRKGSCGGHATQPHQIPGVGLQSQPTSAAPLCVESAAWQGAVRQARVAANAV